MALAVGSASPSWLQSCPIQIFEDRGAEVSITVIIVASRSVLIVCSLYYCCYWMAGRRLLFSVGVSPPTVEKAACEPAARSLVVRWSAQGNSRSCNCAQWNPPFCSKTWRFFLTLSQSWIFRYGGLGCVRKKGITMEGQKDCMNPP